MRVPRVLVKAKERAEPIVKTSNGPGRPPWCSPGLRLLLVITMAVIRSFWLYFAEQKLGLRRAVRDLGLASARPGLRRG